ASSSSGLTRMPTVYLRASQTRPDVTKVKPPTARTPSSWTPSRPAPPPNSRPLRVARVVTPSSAKRPTHRVPNTPQHRWTAVAPTGSSTWSLSKKPTANRSEEHTSELQSRFDLVCRLLLEKKKRRRRRRPSGSKEEAAG